MVQTAATLRHSQPILREEHLRSPMRVRVRESIRIRDKNLDDGVGAGVSMGEVEG